MEKEKKLKNAFLVRLYDAETVRSIEELVKSGRYSSTNELLNCAVAIGIEKIYLEFGKRKLFSQPREIPEMPNEKKIERVEHKLDKVRLLTEDMYIFMNSIEGLVASIYNVQRANVKGEPLSEELLDSGYLAALPDAYREIKENLISRFKRKLSKEQKDS